MNRFVKVIRKNVGLTKGSTEGSGASEEVILTRFFTLDIITKIHLLTYAEFHTA